MSEDSDRFERFDTALNEVRKELDEVVEGIRAAASKAATEVREAGNEVEERLAALPTARAAASSRSRTRLTALHRTGCP